MPGIWAMYRAPTGEQTKGTGLKTGHYITAEETQARAERKKESMR
jgi:hypothetical protein